MALIWHTKASRSFLMNGVPVVRETATANTGVVDYRVYESVGGKVFIKHSLMQNPPNDPYGEFATNVPKISAPSVDAGRNWCELHWSAFKEKVNRY